MESLHGARIVADPPPLAGRYRLGARLGAGGGGVVFAATDERLGRDVAVKVVQTPEVADQRAFDRLVREAHATARTGHPNIVQVLDLGRTDEGHPFIVMERLRGETLEERIARAGRLDATLARDVHAQLLDALAAAHRAGVLHRDVKPANVVLTDLANGGVLVKLLDFGLAALLDAAGTKLSDTGAVLGSPAYLAPERWLGKPADARTDVYAVGVCLFESLAGRPPFAATSITALRGRVITTPAPPLPGVEDDVAAIVRRALAKDPAERFATAAAMRDALLGRPGAPIALRATRVPRWAVATVLVVAIAAAVYTLGRVTARPVPAAARARAPAPLAAPLSPELAVSLPPAAPIAGPPIAVSTAGAAVALAPAPSPPAASSPPRPRARPATAPLPTPRAADHDERVGESIIDPF